MLKLLWRVIVGVFAATGVFALCVVLWVLNGGLSARRPPSAAEAWVMRTLRDVAIPRDARARQDPSGNSAYELKVGVTQYAEHCAGCHAIDGSGQSEIGRGLYPRVPDLRSDATQAMSEGELFHIINGGVRFTGMPALDREDQETWALVRFVKHLPGATKAELEQMKALNPRAAKPAPPR